MYCPVCFQNTLKIRSNGVVKLAFNGKSRNNSLFTYNLQKETHEQLLAKLREKIVDWMSFYSEFNNKSPIKTFEAYSGDFVCTNSCKIDMLNTKVSVVNLIYTAAEVKALLKEEGQKYGVEIEVVFN
jgi:predicted RNA-binding protein with PIN domain